MKTQKQNIQQLPLNCGSKIYILMERFQAEEKIVNISPLLGSRIGFLNERLRYKGKLIQSKQLINQNKKIETKEEKLQKATPQNKLDYSKIMIEQTDSKLQELSEYLQSHQEKTSLSLKIKFTTNQQKNLYIIKVIQEELTHLNHLTSLALLISNHSVLTSEGYHILSDAVLNLKKLKKLQIQIDQDCYLENEGLSILQDMINQLPGLEYLKLEIRENNYIKAEPVQAFLDSLVFNTQLTTLNLYFEDIQSSSINEGNIHFWRGISNLINLEKLKIYLTTHNYGSQDLIELCALLPNLNKLRRLHLAFYNPYLKDTSLFFELFAQLGKMIELRSLKIDYIYYGYITLNGSLRETIITNLKNLKFLEKLKFNDLQELLLKDNFEEYSNLIRDLKYLRSFYWKINDNQIKSCEQIDSLGKSLLELKNLTKLELSTQIENTLQWDKFFQDLSVSLSQMPNLLSLKLEFLIDVCQKGNIILGESFGYLQGLEKLELSILETNTNDLLYGIRKVRNLKQLDIYVKNEKWEDEQETVLLDSISQLSQLERLYLGNKYDNQFNVLGGVINSMFDQMRFQNLELLGTTLYNLRKLKFLKCKIFIQDLDSQNKFDALEKCFENLLELEHLQLKLDIEQQNNNLSSKSLISHLINLKTLDIKFPHQYLNIFGSSVAPYFQKLAQCSLCFKMIEAEQLINILEFLSKSTIKVLNLYIEYLDDCQEFKEQLETVFSKLSSLEELSFQEKNSENLMIYIHGITQMKKLEKLFLDSNVKKLTQKNLYKLDLILQQLKNLQQLDVKINEYTMFRKETNFRYIEIQQFCSFGLTQLNPNTLKSKDFHKTNLVVTDKQQKGSDILFDKSEVNLDHFSINTGDLKECAQEFNPSKVKFDIRNTNQKEKSITISELDFHNLKYLNQLDIHCSFPSKNLVKLKLFQPLKDLTSESKLVKINLDLENLILREEEISYLARNFKFLTNLQQLKYSSKYSMDYYFLLFDSFTYLTNLHEMKLKSSFSDKDAISFEKSLSSMPKLQECQLTFDKGSNFGLAGIISIFTGLKQAKKLKSLDLEMNTDQIIDESSQIPISECFSNLKQLHQLSFSLGINRISSNSLREFFTSIGSLISLNTLDINIKEENPIDQDMLDQLIKSLNKLINLKRNKISIHLENNTNNLGQDFATLFNLNPNEYLMIKQQKQKKDKVLSSQKKNFVQQKLLQNSDDEMDDSPTGPKINVVQQKLFSNSSEDEMDDVSPMSFEQQEKLEIQLSVYEVQLEQIGNSLSLRLESLENLEMNFLEHLNKNIQVSLVIEDSKILKNIKLCAARKIELRLNDLRDKQDIDNVGRFMTKIPNIFALGFDGQINIDLNLEESLVMIAQSLTQLKTVKVLHLKFYDRYKYEIDCAKLTKVLNIIKTMEQLQQLYLKSGSFEVDEQIIPKILRAIPKLVIFDSEKQIYCIYLQF